MAYVKFGKPRQKGKCISNSINFEDIQIKQADSVKNLGVENDKHLNYQKHIVNKCNKVHWNLSKIRNLRPHLSVRNTTQLVLSLVILHIDLSNGLLTGLSNKSHKILKYVQKTSAKVLSNKLHRDSSTKCTLELHWLKVQYRILYKTLITVHKCLFGMAPDNLKK